MLNVTCEVDSPRYQIPAGAETQPWKRQIQNDTADVGTAEMDDGTSPTIKTPTLL